MKPLPLWFGGFLPRSLHFKLSLLVTALVVVVAILLGILLSESIRGILLEEIGKRSLVLAQAVAVNPFGVEGLEKDNPQIVRLLAEEIRMTTDAAYVFVANRQGIRCSHPRLENFGKLFVGGDFHGAIERGESYVSRAVGTLGPSMRGFVPVCAKGGEIIGFVAVGYLESNVWMA